VSFRRFFLVRLGWAAFGLWLAVTLAYAVSLGPKPPPERIICSPGRAETSCLSEPEDFDTGHSLQERYRHFISRLVRDGSPGVSRLSGQEAGRVAGGGVAVQASRGFVSLVLALAAAALLALTRYRFARLLGYVAGGSLATFLFALWVSYLFGFKLGRAPPSGYCDFFNAHADCGGAVDWLSHVIVPAALLALFPAAVYARLVRAEHPRIRKSQETERAFRRLALPLARVAGRDFGFLIGAAIFVEAAFSLQGIGQMLASGTAGYDRMVVQAALVYAAVLAIGVHLVVDLIVGALDPDLRAEWPVARMPKPT
jgi:peptide/nickel transport system permease protein